MSAVRSLAVTSLALVALLALPLAGPDAAQAQQHPFVVGVVGGIGGSVDDDPFGDPALEVLFGYERGVRDRVMFRLGRIDLDSAEDLFDDAGDLTWLTVTSEYRLPEEYYVSGFFVGLGLYQRAGNFGLEDDESWGVTFGVDGEFSLTEHWSVLLELSGHWADLEGDQTFTTAMGGVMFSF